LVGVCGTDVGRERKRGGIEFREEGNTTSSAQVRTREGLRIASGGPGQRDLRRTRRLMMHISGFRCIEHFGRGVRTAVRKVHLIAGRRG